MKVSTVITWLGIIVLSFRKAQTLGPALFYVIV